MPQATPTKALNYAKTKFGFSLHAILGLLSGVVIGFILYLYLKVHVVMAGLLGGAVGIAGAAAIGKGTERVARAWFKPRPYRWEGLPNNYTSWQQEKSIINLLKQKTKRARR